MWATPSLLPGKTLVMGVRTISMAEGLGSQVEDSIEVRKKNGCVPNLQTHILPTQTTESGALLAAITTPQTYLELCPEIKDTPLPRSTGLDAISPQGLGLFLSVTGSIKCHET